MGPARGDGAHHPASGTHMNDVGLTATGATPEAGAVERQVAGDMIRRGLPFLPVLVVVGGILWGVAGALSVTFAVGLVVVNLGVSAALLAWAARTSLALLMGVALLGFLVRLGLITVAVLAVKDQWWVELVPLGLALILTHLGLLLWETRHISASLAFPGLKPAKG